MNADPGRRQVYHLGITSLRSPFRHSKFPRSLAFLWSFWSPTAILTIQLANAVSPQSRVGLRWPRNMQKHCLSAGDTAAHLGVSRDTIYKWPVPKNMPAHKAGGLWKFLPSGVVTCVKAGKAARIHPDPSHH